MSSPQWKTGDLAKRKSDGEIKVICWELSLAICRRANYFENRTDAEILKALKDRALATHEWICTPLRTPEEHHTLMRELAVETMLMALPTEDIAHQKRLCELLYDAGYRKALLND